MFDRRSPVVSPEGGTMNKSTEQTGIFSPSALWGHAIRPARKTRRRQELKILTPLDLKQSASSPDHSVWIVEKLLRTNRQRISLLCGSPHAGKSTIARQLAIAVAQGKPFLGRSTMQCKVAYWQSEETEEDTKQDFEKSGMQLTDSIVILHPTPGE